MDRKVIPEMLDSLPANDPSAEASRHDIRRYNMIMGNFRWLTGALQRYTRSGEMAVELAPGDGSLGRMIGRHRRSHQPRLRSVLGIDRLPRPATWPRPWPWIQANLLEWDGYAGRPVVFGNFILHHFSEEELARLGHLWNRHCRVLIFNETLRSPRSIWLARASFLLGANAITRHDALASIHAGFRGEELGRMLQLDRDQWNWWAHPTLLGAYRFIAVRGQLADA